jgi:hypothetical protein
MIATWYVSTCKKLFGDTISDIIRSETKSLPVLLLAVAVGIGIALALGAPSRKEVFIRYGILALGVLCGHFWFP